MAQDGTGTQVVPWRAALAHVLVPGGILPRAGRALAAGLAEEAGQRRLFPWLAVAFGAGILLFFGAADRLPSPAPAVAAAVACGGAAIGLRARPVGLALALGLAFLFLGFAAAVIRVSTVAAPVLARTTIAPLAGFVEGIDERDEGARLIVRVHGLGTLGPAERPARVRVSFRRPEVPRPGDFVTARVRLLPPPEPARPGGYDFARDAYFRGIGAVGSVLGTITVGPPPEPPPWDLRLAAAVDEARNALTRRIAAAQGGQAGAVAAALVTGKRGLIAPETSEVLRAAGIYHVVSISGLHMVLAAGVIFWLIRAGLALVPALALGWPIKKIAAVGAMAGVTAYCAFSGWDLAAERSLVMTLVMLGAILVDRPALSLRNLALAALIALAREPEGLLGPSFQMSFGAVAGLIACARLIDGRVWRAEEAVPLGRLVAAILTATTGTLATTLVAQIATAPFATYHFQAVQPFGLVGNALTLPLVSLVVMPAAVLGILAHPFALDRPVWWAMGLAVRGMLDIAAWIRGFDHATLTLPAFGTGALALMSAGLLLLVLPASRLRWIGLVPALAGFALAAQPARFDLYVDREGGGAALRGADGRLQVLGRPPPFVLEQWLRADGDGRSRDDPGLKAGPRCDRLGCVATYGTWDVAVVRDKRAFAQDCARAAVIVARAAAPPGCAARLVLDRAFLAAHGATALRFGPDGPDVVTARTPGETPPWRPPPAAVPKPRPEPARPAAEPEPAPEPDDGPDADP